jgi:hypothetical protein
MGRDFDLQKDWKRVAAQAMSIVSGRRSSTMPIRMKRKFTDMGPVTPGRLTLQPDATVEIMR